MSVDQKKIAKKIKNYGKALNVPSYHLDDSHWDLINSESVYVLVESEKEKALSRFIKRLPSLIEQFENSDAHKEGGVSISELIENHFM